MTPEELKNAINELWLECAKHPQPDYLILCPLPARDGNWLRLFCKLFGHRWRTVQFFNITHECRVCRAWQVEKWNAPELEKKVYDWWRS